MYGLRKLQRDFSQAVFSGDTSVADAIQANGLSGERRLQVYRNNTYASLTETLASTYPVVWRLVGEGFFRYAAHRYITQHPSTCGNLHAFGGLFPAFLTHFEPASALGYLPDIARLEWACEQVFHAAEQPPLDPSVLAGVPEDCYEALRFIINPAVRLLASDYPILRIWQVNQEGFEGDQTVDLGEGGVRLLVFRNARLDIEIQPLEAGEFALLQALADGQTFATACEQALHAQEDFDMAASFQRQIVQGTLVDFCYLPNTRQRLHQPGL